MAKVLFPRFVATTLFLVSLAPVVQAAFPIDCADLVEKVQPKNQVSFIPDAMEQNPAEQWARFYDGIQTAGQIRSTPLAQVDASEKLLGILVSVARSSNFGNLLDPQSNIRAWSHLSKDFSGFTDFHPDLKQIRKMVFGLYEATYKSSDSWYWPKGAENRVNREFLIKQVVPKIAMRLSELDIARINGAELSASLLAQSETWIALGKMVLGDTIFFAMGLPPVAIPNLSPMRLAPIPKDIKAAIDDGDLPRAQELARTSSSLREWAVANGVYNNLVRAASIGLMAVILWYLISHEALIQQYVRMALVSDQAAESYEKQTYSSDAVVAQQLKMWEDAQPAPPTVSQISQKRLFYQDQERRGILKMY